MATNAKNLAELLNTDTTVAVGDIADGSVTTAKVADDAVTSAKLDTNIAIDGTLTVDTNTLHVDATNNRVGINTLSPSYNLEIQGGSSNLLSYAVGNSDTNMFNDIQNTNTGSNANAVSRLITSNVAGNASVSADFQKTKAGALNINNNETNSAAHIAIGVSGGTRMHIDTAGNTGIGSTSAATYATNTKVVQLTTNSNDAGVGASIRQAPWTSYQGRGYKHSEVFALSNITSSTLISQLSGTGANGFRCLFEYIVTGHTSGIGNSHFWGKYYWEGGTGAPVLIQADYEENATLQITFDTTVSNRLQLFLASHNASNGFNGIAEVTYWVPVDFASSNYTTS